MPVDDAGNKRNGNDLGAHRLKNTNGSYATSLSGRTTGEPIYEVDATEVIRSGLGGANFWKVINSIKLDTNKDTSEYRRSDHDDRDGNLPVAPPAQGYREYHVPENKFANPGYVRLVADLTNKRIYITPTHYDRWNDGSTSRNPFYLLRRAHIYNGLFKE